MCTRAPCSLAAVFKGANEQFDDTLLCSDAFETPELPEDIEAARSPLPTLNGWLAAAAGSALRFFCAILGRQQASGSRISAMDARNTLALFGNKFTSSLAGIR